MDNLWIWLEPLLDGFEPTPLKKNEKVNWDDDIPSRWEHESHVPNHQPVMGCVPSI